LHTFDSFDYSNPCGINNPNIFDILLALLLPYLFYRDSVYKQQGGQLGLSLVIP
tara:strand:- start:483 stop:644 length:162 start_codon:yes stop_codon:yes gene_type:complete